MAKQTNRNEREKETPKRNVNVNLMTHMRKIKVINFKSVQTLENDDVKNFAPRFRIFFFCFGFFV